MENRTISILLYLCVISLFVSCETQHRTKPSSFNSPKMQVIAKARYDISLIAAERSIGNSELQREPSIETVIEQGVVRYSFEDEMVKMIWLGGPIDIVFTVSSKTDHPIKIIWDDARFIDEKGISHRLNHSGIAYEERNLSQSPTIVATRGKLEDFLHPADYFQWIPIGGLRSDKKEGYWDRAPFLPTQIKGTAEELRAKADIVIGKTFRVIFPLEINNGRIDYLCTFRINNVEVTTNEEKEEQLDRNLSEKKGRGRTGKRLQF